MKYSNTKIIFLLKSKSFQVALNFKSISDVDAKVYLEMFSNKKYIVKSKVTKETFQSFIDHWLYNKIPNINEKNLNEFIQLSDEFDRMKNIIQIFIKNKLGIFKYHNFTSLSKKKIKLMQTKYNSNNLSKLNFEMQNNSTLKASKNQKINLLSMKTNKFHLIINYLFRKDGIESFFEYSEYKKELVDACINEDAQTVDILTKTKIKTDKSIYILNKKEKTARLFRDLALTEQVFIPRSIYYQNDEYLITSIMANAFIKQNNFYSIEFPNDSELRIIESKAFFLSKLEYIIIPSHVTYIGKDSFSGYLKKIEFSDQSELEEIDNNAFRDCCLKEISIPSSVRRLSAKSFNFFNYQFDLRIVQSKVKNIISYDNKYILGKSNFNSDKYDVLLYALRNVETAIIPPFIKVIAPYAFYFCRFLKNVSFSKKSKLKMIGKKAFSNTLLEKIIIPSSVIHIGKGAFIESNNLKEVEFSANSKLISIGEYAFLCDFLERISIPSSVEKLGKGWFINGYQPTRIQIIPNKKKNIINLNDLMIIGKSNKKCDIYDMIIIAKQNIKNVLIPNNIKQICPYAFYHCKNIQSIVFEEKSELKIIDEHAFESSSLKEITIPPHVVQIGKNSFQYCDKLAKIEFGNESKLESIGESAFQSTLLERILIPPNVKYIGKFAFSNCRKLEKIVFQNNYLRESAIKIGQNAFEYLLLKKIVFPRKQKMKNEIIPKKTFYSSSIEKIVLPSNIKLEKSWCKEISNLNKMLIFPNEKQNIKKWDNDYIIEKSNLYSNIFDVLIYARRDIEIAIIPPFIKTISSYSFQDCIHLKEIKMSDKSELQVIGKNAFSKTAIEKIIISKRVFQIGNQAFGNCKNLTHLEFHKHSMLQSIGDYAFYRASIKSVTIPSSTKIIGKCAFDYCIQLNEVNIPKNSNLREIKDMAFASTCIEKFFIPSKLEKIDEFWILDVFSLNEVTISPDNQNFAYINEKMIVTKSDPKKDIFDILFLALKNIKKANIPPTVKKIACCCFNCCKQLTKVRFLGHSELKIIPSYSFSRTSIRSISIPQSVKEIEKIAFSECGQLKNVEFSINSELKSIRSFAFEYSSIDKITIPRQVSFIGESVFEGCNHLRRIDFPPELRILDETSFMDTSIESIILPSKIIYIDKFTFSGCKTIKIIEVDEILNNPAVFINGLLCVKPEYLLIPRKYRKFLD